MFDTMIIRMCKMHLNALDLMDLEATYNILMEYGKTQPDPTILKKAGLNWGITFPDRYFESLCFYRTQLEKDQSYIYQKYNGSILNADIKTICLMLEKKQKRIKLIMEILAPLCT